MNKFLFLFLLFIIYSFIGWLIEMTYVSIKSKKIYNRGFLIGPYCPIYGVSALLMILLLSKYKNDFVILFLVGIVISSFLEYITSYLMEKIFKARWWDYSNKPFNIDGRVCLINSLLFGILCILLVVFINPFIVNSLNKIPSSFINIIAYILMILFIIDFTVSFKIIFNIKKSTYNIRHDYTSEISDKVRETLMKKSKSFNRILKAFPNFRIIYKIRNK